MIATGEITESRAELLQDSAEIILENAAKPFQEAGISDVKCEHIVGSPAASIANYAEKKGADLIVLGYHGVSGGGHELLGGVARKLTNISKISTLVVRDNP
jgi:nucleotide-binding universal stress UspA family protein